MNGPSPLILAKECLRIPRLAELLGWNWKPGRSCRVPYREDCNASGSVFEDGRLFHDYASGETLDAPALLARVTGIANDAACKLFIELAGVKVGCVSLPAVVKESAPPETGNNLSGRRKPFLPRLFEPSRAEISTIAKLRGLSIDGVSLAARRGFLFSATWREAECWALTDASRWLCQLRRLDGEPFLRADGTPYKAHACRGSWGAWPLGCEEARAFPSVAFVEGGGDFLAALHFIAMEGSNATCAPVAMLGASNRIPAPALAAFAGKRVRIFAHIDQPNDRGARPGYEAAARWEAQLAKAGARATTFDLSGLRQADGSPVADLNDVARISPEDYEADVELSALMTF